MDGTVTLSGVRRGTDTEYSLSYVHNKKNSKGKIATGNRTWELVTELSLPRARGVVRVGGGDPEIWQRGHFGIGSWCQNFVHLIHNNKLYYKSWCFGARVMVQWVWHLPCIWLTWVWSQASRRSLELFRSNPWVQTNKSIMVLQMIFWPCLKLYFNTTTSSYS